jgi:hypothetical protein
MDVVIKEYVGLHVLRKKEINKILEVFEKFLKTLNM